MRGGWLCAEIKEVSGSEGDGVGEKVDVLSVTRGEEGFAERIEEACDDMRGDGVGEGMLRVIRG